MKQIEEITFKERGKKAIKKPKERARELRFTISGETRAILRRYFLAAFKIVYCSLFSLYAFDIFRRGIKIVSYIDVFLLFLLGFSIIFIVAEEK